MEFHRAIKVLRCSVALSALLVAAPAFAQLGKPVGSTPKAAEAWASEPMVDLAKACPTIAIDLRYATTRNLAGKPIYPAHARCFVRQSLVQRLEHAQDELNKKGYGLKIWDAYRPEWAQKALWKAVPNPDFLQPPSSETSMHTRGIAVDVTLVTLEGGELKMPTDFDAFTPDASMFYKGGDPVVAKHLRVLQIAMGRAGFLGNHTEWWHFVVKDFENCKPVDLDIAPRLERNERLASKLARNARD